MIFEVGDVVRRIKGNSGGMVVGDTATVKEVVNSDWMTLVEYGERHLIERFELVERKEKTMEDRIKEVARMFSGEIITDEALKVAEKMLGQV